MTAGSDGRADQALDAELTHVTAEIARCDTKAGLLLALAGAGLALAGTGAKDYRLPTATQILSGGGAATVLAAILVLLQVVLPARGGSTPHGWPRWATCTPEQVRTEIRTDRRAERLCVLAGLCHRKMRGIRTAIHLLEGGIALLALAALAITLT